MDSHETSTVAVNARIQSMVRMALFAALLSASALFAAFIYPIPITLQLLFVALAALVLGPKEALGAVALYVALGAAGLPVFSGGRGGLGILAGPTGGFLIGFILAAGLGALVNLILSRTTVPTLVNDILTVLVVGLTIYATGVAWLIISLGLSVSAALAAGVVPFLIPDIIKVTVAIIIAGALRRSMAKLPSAQIEQD